MLKVLLKDGSYYLLGNIFSQAVGLLSVVAAMRMLTIAEFGVYSYALAFVTFFSFIADGGLSQYLINEIAKNEEKAEAIYRRAQGLQLVLSIAILAILTISAAVIHDLNEFTVIIILGLGAIINGYASPIFSSLIALGHREVILKKDITVSIIRLIYLLTIIAYEPSLFLFSSTNLICALSALAFSFSIKKNPKFSYFFKQEIDIVGFRNFLSKGLPFSILMLSNILYNKIDVVMLKYISGNTEVAIYSGATQFIYPFMFVSTVLANSIFPHLSRNTGNDSVFNKVRNTGTMIMSGAGLALSAGLFVSSKLFFNVLFDGKYDSSLAVYNILVWYLFIVFSYGACSNGLVARGGVKIVLKLTGVMLALNIGLNAILIRSHGAVGAAIATIICEIVILICVTTLSFRAGGTQRTASM